MTLFNRRGQALLLAAAVAAVAAGCSNKVTTAETTGDVSAPPAVSVAAVTPDTVDSAKTQRLDAGTYEWYSQIRRSLIPSKKPRHIDYDTLTDKRDGKTYRTITVGGKTWMAENLNYESPKGGSSCLGKNAENCEKFGRLYDKKAAQEACPAGWLLPFCEDWTVLAYNVSGTTRISHVVGRALRSASGWEKSGLGRGMDNEGFAALPGGSEPPFDDDDKDILCAWWITPSRSGSRYDGFEIISLRKDTLTIPFKRSDKDRYSVRCIKDDGRPLALTAGEGGTLSTYPDKTVFMTGDTVTITAVPNSGYEFARWKNRFTNYSNYSDSAVITVVAHREMKIEAVFRAAPGAVGTLYDKRDGKSYKTAQIGGQVWMAQNLNYKTGDSRCYNDNPSYCDKYGRLYGWNTAKTACPAGWHLPSNEEWSILANAARDDADTYPPKIGDALKAEEGWYSDDDYDDEECDGTDYYGFAALPGGGRAADNPAGGKGAGGQFYDIGSLGAWWTAAESAHNNGNAGFRGLYSFWSGLVGNDINKGYGLSVRCVMD
ncbi:hypothetical protein R80B4_02796 [Fibrobacteres bacterium R8-0-B4]